MLVLGQQLRIVFCGIYGAGAGVKSLKQEATTKSNKTGPRLPGTAGRARQQLFDLCVGVGKRKFCVLGRDRSTVVEEGHGHQLHLGQHIVDVCRCKGVEGGVGRGDGQEEGRVAGGCCVSLLVREAGTWWNGKAATSAFRAAFVRSSYACSMALLAATE